MQCMKCKCPDSHIVKTFIHNIKNIVVRRRECLKCGERFTTHEMARDFIPKKNNESLSRNVIR